MGRVGVQGLGERAHAPVLEQQVEPFAGSEGAEPRQGVALEAARHRKAAREHAETYLRDVFRFIGVERIDVVSAEGMAIGPEVRQANIANAERTIAALAA